MDNMNNEQFHDQEFEDEWQSVRQYDALPVSYTDHSYTEENDSEFIEDKQPKEKVKRKLTGFQRIIKYQLIICATIVILLTGLKFINVTAFQTVRNWYYEQLNSELIITDVFNQFSGNTNEI